jgi:hypothetical protein
MMLPRGHCKSIVLLEEESAGIPYYLKGELTEVMLAR